ncbi:MAG: threonine--tRNA ligase [Thermoplasmata archaeon]|nr:threonine--tRNA ligase [Thermoplasmata archaeon]
MTPHPSPSVSIRWPDGTSTDIPAGTSAGDALRHWNAQQTRLALAAILDGELIDLAHPLTHAGVLAPLLPDDKAGREVLQHSAAHLVAKAVTELIPDALPTDGPPTDEGFYYDFEMRPLTADELPALEAKIRETVRRKDRFERSEISKTEAEALFRHNPHKLGYIAKVPDGRPVSIYRTGTFTDLCRGPHVPDAGWLEGIHILGFSAVIPGTVSSGGAFQRVRGVAFPTRAELETYLKRRTEAEARDHRILGPRLELFTFSDEIPGFPFWNPKGMIVVRELEAFVREHLAEAGYSEIRTPLIYPQSIYETSGHWEHYRENMFLTTVDDRTFGLKPMNCPGAMLVFRSRSRSYRELPMRLAEFAPLHRLEASGTIHGLTRAREFVQDDAHVFVTEEQIPAEIRTLIEWVQRAMGTFHLEWTAELSTRPAKFLGTAETWDRAESMLKSVLDGAGLKYKISPGEGAFYGPKIDIHIRDSLGRSWQCGTIQLDYQLPDRFGLQYQGTDGTLHTPVVVHRVILGTWERFLGVFLEHCAGWLPPWLAPVQVRVLPVTERQVPRVTELAAEWRTAGLRVESTDSQDTLSKRIREAEVAHVPYIAVVGDREVAAGTVALRAHGQKGQRSLTPAQLVEQLRAKVATREYDP